MNHVNMLVIDHTKFDVTKTEAVRDKNYSPFSRLYCFKS